MRQSISTSIAAILLLFALSFEMLTQTTPVDDLHIVIRKSAHSLKLVKGRRLVKSYSIALGFSPMGDKQFEGDGKTPLGEFYIFTKNDQSKFYLSLGLSYPNAEDAMRGLADKLINKEQYDLILKAIKDHKMPLQDTALGGEIYIHGGGTANDWTDGCVALRDTDIKELFDLVNVGMRVTILP
jgi:murein L,D-transpeptidase YafK